MAVALKLFIDTTKPAASRLTVYKGEGGQTKLNEVYQYNEIPLEVTVVEPSESGGVASGDFDNGFHRKLDLTGETLRAVLGPTPAGTTGPTLLASFVDFVWDAANRKFVGTFPIDTAAVDTYIGALPERTAYFALTLTGTAFQTLFQSVIKIVAVADEGSAGSPTPVDDYLTEVESVAMFVPKAGTAGGTFYLVSPDGTKKVTFSVSNDGDLLTTASTIP